MTSSARTRHSLPDRAARLAPSGVVTGLLFYTGGGETKWARRWAAGDRPCLPFEGRHSPLQIEGSRGRYCNSFCADFGKLGAGPSSVLKTGFFKLR